MTDEDHIAFMLDGGTRGMIERLVDGEDAWSFGGSLWISKTSPYYKAGPGKIIDLGANMYFAKAWFETGPTGWAVWFHAPGMPFDGRMLCGWVPAAREAEVTGWLSFLNDEILERVRERNDALVGELEALASADGPVDGRRR